MITQQIIKDRLCYDATTGVFYWKSAKASTLVGKAAGHRAVDGYIRIELRDENGKRKAFLAHRLAWFYTHGIMPPEEIDHIDGAKSNNALANLRLADRSENVSNTRVRKDNKFGLKGVRQNGIGYSAKITKNGKVYHLGTYGTPELAHAVYCAIAPLLHGEFAKT